jgi:predicted ATP-binding protein involved in virulence
MYNCRINSLEVEHIGAFEKLELKFAEKVLPNKAEIHIFTGKNGTGKTTLLEMLASGFQNNNGNKDIAAKIHNALLKAFKLVCSYELFSDGSDINTISYFGNNIAINHQAGELFFDNSTTPLGLNYISKIYNFGNNSFDFAFFAYSGYRRIVKTNLSAIQELNNNPLSDALDFNNSINPQLLIQWLANTITKKALAFSRTDNAAVTKYTETISRIENAVSEITGQIVKFDLLDNPLSIGITVDGLKLDFNLLPDGMKSIISWIADLLMRMDRIPWSSDINVFDRNFILFLDEIEVHLHPEWQRKILPVVQKLFPNAQIFISTHSPFVVGSVDGAWIYKFKKEGPYSVLDGEPILSEDGKSFQYILDETFDIQNQFGIEVEKDLAVFYNLKSRILRQELDINDAAFVELTKKLAEQSIELENIVGMEIKQLERLLNKKLVV